jgi:hypothetical protein
MTAPFDPSKPVRTSDGKPARIICTDAREAGFMDYPIIALVADEKGEEWINHFESDGSAIGKRNRLVNIPERIEGWVNVYREGHNHPAVRTSCIIHDRKRADSAARGQNRIACIKVSFEEGEGL